MGKLYLHPSYSLFLRTIICIVRLADDLRRLAQAWVASFVDVGMAKFVFLSCFRARGGVHGVCVCVPCVSICVPQGIENQWVGVGVLCVLCVVCVLCVCVCCVWCVVCSVRVCVRACV